MATSVQQRITDYVIVTQQVTYEDDGANTVADIPAATLVPSDGVQLVITTLFAGTSPTVDVGDGDGADDWVDNGDVTETTAGVYKGTTGNGAVNVEHGKYYSSAGQLKITIGGTTLTAGECHAVIRCIPLSGLV